MGQWPAEVDFANVVSVNQNAPFLTGRAYALTYIFVSRFTDGVHFSPAIQVNRDKQPACGREGHDHFQPAIAVDPWGGRRHEPRSAKGYSTCLGVRTLEGYDGGFARSSDVLFRR